MKTIREVQDTYIPQSRRVVIFFTVTSVPILAARGNALDVAGVRVVDAETIVTEAIADLNIIESQLTKAAKALGENKGDVAASGACPGLGPGRRFPIQQGGTLRSVAARDVLWLPRRSLEENNAAQAIVNLSSRSNSGCGSTAKWPHRTSARRWTRCSVRSRNWMRSSVRREISPPLVPNEPIRRIPSRSGGTSSMGGSVWAF